MNVSTKAYRLMLSSIIIALLFMSLTTTAVQAASVSLRWDPNVPKPEGYRVFARKSGQAYDYQNPHWEGRAVSCRIIGLEDFTKYYFVVRAYEGDLESADSEEVHYVPSVTDGDSDGLPDAWESDFGLNPNRNDAKWDPDGDGISNIDEYRAGLDPDHPGVGTRPNRPDCLFPLEDSEVDTDLILDAGSYQDVDGDAHIASQWQIYNTGTGDCLLDVISDLRLTELKVPCMLLTGNQRYRWRVRFLDSGGKASPWSSDNRFRTLPEVNDVDGNGILDNQENGIFSLQANHSLAASTGRGIPTQIEVLSGDTVKLLERAVLVNPDEWAIDPTTPTKLPSAMVAYKLTLHRPGERAVIAIHLSEKASAGSKCVKYDEVNGWQDYSDHAVLSQDRRSILIEVKDGGYGDADGLANGIVLDPSGLSEPAALASSASAGGGGGGGGGCFMGSLTEEVQTAPDLSALWQWIKYKIEHLVGMV